VLLAGCKATGWDCECIPRIASGLGGGLGRQGEVCGALTAGVLVVGLVHGRDSAEEKEAKDVAHGKAGEFVRRFAEVNGAVRCRDLIGLDISDEKGRQEYSMLNLKKEKCSKIVRNAVRELLELLAE
jgi:C_GCAxxG_C_C family probable redox protein